MKYRKKPVVIDAVQWTGDNLNEVFDLVDENADAYPIRHVPALRTLDISTTEGVMSASPNDWVIRGVEGEIYPCKPSIFEATYERVDE